MEIQIKDRKFMSNAIEKIHAQLSVLRSHVTATGSPDAIDEFDKLELPILKQIRKIRSTFDLPYGVE